ncbi:MAG: lysine-sensitive aspartokinase 3 [Bacteroidetes bacterium]|nr:lysine-sensitive aspartokinase 3 [Bacteroidota bacterium]MCW5895660.1 lysine-sensitive aspartokinase 3 [Bacteroidota bacterium]
MIVMKFGGTSVEDASALRNVAQIVDARRRLKPLVVLSACAGVTNALIKTAHDAAAGNKKEALKGFAAMHERHNMIADELLGSDAHSAKEVFESDFAELRQLVHGLSILNELTPRALDQIVAHGERWSSRLLSLFLQKEKIPALFVDARTVMITGNEFTKAAPLFDIIEEKANEILQPPLEAGNIVVTQGFIGSTKEGITTTIGRGGSDYSAAILGAVLNADEIQIWTDVDGFLTADPKIVSDARKIREMTFTEAAELAYFGAKVLHPSTILPAVQKNIPVRVLNSRRPEGEGTLITNTAPGYPGCIVKSVAYKKGITVIGIQSTRMLMAHGFLARVFEVFERHKKSVDVVVTSEVGVSLTVDNDSDVEKIEEELARFADVKVERNKVVFCVVGERMKLTKGVAARVFSALADAKVNIELISQGGSEINLTFVVDEADVDRTVRALHIEFFSDNAEEAGLFDEIPDNSNRV